MSLVNFLNGTGPDYQGRYLRDIWDFDDKAIEQTHDFIQWIFPLTEKSMSVPGVPVLSTTDIEAIRTSEVTRSNLERSARWYLGFLRRNDQWIRSYDHNHLRITRAIKSTRMLIGNKLADEMKTNIILLLGDNLNSVSQKSREFWKNA